jgi:hypothetical protein
VYAIFPSLLILKEEEAGAAFYICNLFVEYAPKQAYLILYFQQKFLKASQTVLPRHEECEKPAFQFSGALDFLVTLAARLSCLARKNAPYARELAIYLPGPGECVPHARIQSYPLQHRPQLRQFRQRLTAQVLGSISLPGGHGTPSLFHWSLAEFGPWSLNSASNMALPSCTYIHSSVGRHIWLLNPPEGVCMNLIIWLNKGWWFSKNKIKNVSAILHIYKIREI